MHIDREHGFRFRFRFTWLCTLLLGCTLATMSAAADQAFEAGVAASKRGDYRQAVEHFRDARRQGLDTVVLHHNLGVAYYRLGRYAEARRAFRHVSQSPKMRAIAFYNLGLIAQKEGDEGAAHDWFRKAHRAASTGKLRRLAASQLRLTERAVAPYTLYLEAFAGHDSNPRLADEAADQFGDRSEESDAVLGVLATGRRVFVGDWDRGATVIGAAYADFHPDLDDENIGLFTGGLGFHHTIGRWRHEYEITANRLRLGGDTLQTTVRAGLRSQRRLSRQLIAELRLRGEHIDGENDNGFAYLSGWRHEARVRLRGRHGKWRWKTHYELEYNERDDLHVGSDFFSVSPIRHEIGIGIERLLIGELSGEARLAFRYSEYRDPEIRGGTEQGKREDDRLEAGLGVSHPLGGGWTGRIETLYWDNASECGGNACDRFEYDRVEALVSIGRSF